MVLFIILFNMFLLILSPSHDALAKMSSKIMTKAGRGNEELKPMLHRQNTVLPLQSYPFSSEISQILREMYSCSRKNRKLETKLVNRHKRGIGFPSLEASLLSLAFLTFAVYLVNLIQSIIKVMNSRQV